MIHRLSDVKTKDIGKDTKVWQFTVILKNASLGKNCNICSSVFIENDVKIYNNVTVKNGAKIFDGVVIKSDVFVGPNVIFTNDKLPRSKTPRDNKSITIIEKGVSIGSGAIILPGITIGKYSMIGAGSVVTKDVKPYSLIIGNPGLNVGKVNEKGKVINR